MKTAQEIVKEAIGSVADNYAVRHNETESDIWGPIYGEIHTMLSDIVCEIERRTKENK